MPLTARILLLVKIVGIALGLLVTALTFHAQRVAQVEAEKVPWDGLKIQLAPIADDASPEVRAKHFEEWVKISTLSCVNELLAAQRKQSFVQTIVSYWPFKWLAIVSGLFLLVGEFWQFFRTPTKGASQPVAGSSMPIEASTGAAVNAVVPGKASANAVVGTGAASIEIKITT